MALVEGEELLDVDVREPVAIRHEKCVVLHVLLDPLHPPSGHRVDARVSKRHLEVEGLAVAVVPDLPAAADGHGAVLRHRLVVEEVVLNHTPLVAKAEHKATQTVVAKEPHDVPEERPVADLHHGLGAVFRLLAHPRALTAAQNDDIHRVLKALKTWLLKQKTRDTV